jgi:O-antigen/teichoic acid export membrane protein
MIALFSLEYLFIIEKNDDKKIFYALNQLGFISGFIFMVGLFLLAKSIASYYHNPELIKIIRYGSFFVFVEIFRKIFKYGLQNRLKFFSIANYETINVIVYSLIIFAFIRKFPNAFFLTFVFYFGNFIETILLFLKEFRINSQPFFESFYFKNIKMTKGIISKEKKFLTFTTFSNLSAYISGTIPILIFGRYFSSTYVGIYYMANQLITIPVNLVTNSLQQIFFPSFSKLSKKLIREKISRYGIFVVSTLWVLLALYIFWATKLVPLIVNPEWEKAISAMLIISFSIASTILISPISSIPIIFKRTDLEFYWNLLTCVLNTIAILYGAKDGFYYALIFFTASLVFSHFLFLLIILHLIEIDISSFLKKIFLTFLIAIGYYVSLFFAYQLTLYKSLFISLILIIIYFLMLNVFSKGKFLDEFRNIITLKK